jgi:peptidoglycan/xylan/chitin deacetylase (PgdA/CDA1 family)
MAVPLLPPAWQAGELVRLPTRAHVVALTFDGGGNDVGAAGVLATLRRTGTPATFFLTGRFVRLYPTVARQVGRRFPVGDHTVDHADLTRLPAAQVAWEIEAARTQIRRVTGSDAKPWFRFPYGARDARTVGIARRLGYLPVRWTVDTWGWMGSCCQTAKGVLQRTLADLMPGEIVLMHLGSARDGSRLDAQALAAVIAAVRARGFRFTTFAGYAVPAGKQRRH